MERSKTLPLLFLLLLAALFAGCSGSGGDGGSRSDTAPSAPPPDADAPAAPGSRPTPLVGAIVVYSENGSILHAAGASGEQRVAIADDATYRGTTEDGWVILLQGGQLLSIRLADGAARILDDTPGSKQFRGVFDTNYVVYGLFTGDAASLHVVRADGSDRLLPVAPRAGELAFIAVTPSRRVLYEVCDPGTAEDAEPCINRRLLSAMLDGGDERRVLPGAPLIRHITADDRLVYDRTTAVGIVVSIVKSDGSDDRPLAAAGTFFAGALPNGRIVYSRMENGQLDLYSVDPDGTSTRALATSGEDELYDGAVPGGRVLFRRGAPNARGLYSVDETTGDVRALQVAGDNFVRAVAPNGTVIVSARFGTGAEAQDNLYSVRADGTALRAIADTSDMEWFEALAPDGRVIYMRCIPAPAGPCGDPSAQSDLYSVNQNATGTIGLATSGAFEVARAVTKNNLVVYGLLAGEQWDLYSVPTAGGRAQPLADTTNDERFLTVVEPGTTGENPG